MNNKQTYEMSYRLNSGMVSKINLNKEDILIWIDCFKNNKMFIPSHGYILGINPNLVACFSIPSFENHEFNKQSYQETESTQEGIIIQNIATYKIPPGKAPFKIECQCKARYIVTIYDTTSTLNCKYCGKQLYRDYEKGILETRFGPGYLLSN